MAAASILRLHKLRQRLWTVFSVEPPVKSLGCLPVFHSSCHLTGDQKSLVGKQSD